MLRILGLCLNLFLLTPSLALSQESKNSFKVSDYLFDSLGKLDDLIEEVEYKEQSNSLDRISFTISTLINLTPISVSMISYNLKHSKLAIPVVARSATVETRTTLSELFNSFLLSTTSVKLLSEAQHFQANIESFSIHRNDLVILKRHMKSLREKQFSLLEQQLKVKRGSDFSPGTGIEIDVLKSRPSYRSIYNECSRSVGQYKDTTKLKILEGSLHDLYRLTAFTPSVIKLQLDSKLTSPTLKKYLSQDVLPMALNNCFATEPGASRETYQDFIQRLKNIENLARGIVVSSAGTAFVAAEHFLTHPKVKLLTEYFSKTSLFVAKKAAIITTMITGVYCSFQLKKAYDIASDRDMTRYTEDEYKSYIKNYFHKDISQKINKLESDLKSSALKEKDKSELQNELNNWKTVLRELST